MRSWLAALLAVVVLVASPSAARCEEGDEFVGYWVAVFANGRVPMTAQRKGKPEFTATMTVTRAGEKFQLAFRGGDARRGMQGTGVYKDGALEGLRAGKPFRLVVNKPTGFIVTGFTPPFMKKIASRPPPG